MNSRVTTNTELAYCIQSDKVIHEGSVWRLAWTNRIEESIINNQDLMSKGCLPQFRREFIESTVNKDCQSDYLYFKLDLEKCTYISLVINTLWNSSYFNFTHLSRHVSLTISAWDLDGQTLQLYVQSGDCSHQSLSGSLKSINSLPENIPIRTQDENTNSSDNEWRQKAVQEFDSALNTLRENNIKVTVFQVR